MRGEKLYLTDIAKANFKRMQETWSHDLEGIIDDGVALDQVNATLKEIERKLSERRGK
jgi:hypothetical protein